MRENMGLYRGKRMGNGEWIEGSFLLDGEAHRPSDKEHLPFSKCYIVPETDRENVKTSFNDGSLFLETTAYHVIPETVGQYTDLKDKNGKKIFEGDIVRVDDDVKETFPQVEDGDVRFARGGFFVGSYGDILRSLDVIADFKGVLRGEVIGNIHDNPELLEAGNV